MRHIKKFVKPYKKCYTIFLQKREVVMYQEAQYISMSVWLKPANEYVYLEEPRYVTVGGYVYQKGPAVMDYSCILSSSSCDCVYCTE